MSREEIIEVVGRALVPYLERHNSEIKRELSESLARHAIKAIEQSGHVIVPRVPTEAMKDAAAEESYGCTREHAEAIAKDDKFDIRAWEAGVTYDAMLRSLERDQ
jgi:16S rRNA U1498 N3-methylase RsmE